MNHQLKNGDETLMTATLLQIWDMLLLLNHYNYLHYGQLAFDIFFLMSILKLYDYFHFEFVIPLDMESFSFLK